jgi:DNA-directed RNA polymerase specialized sigma subunit
MAVHELTSVKVVLASADLETCEILCRQTQSMSIHVDTCRDLESAAKKISQTKCEGLLVDLQVDPNSLSMVTMLHQSASNRTAVSLAILPDGGQKKSALEADRTDKTPFRLFLSLEMKQLVSRSMARLTEKERCLLTLYYFERVTHEADRRRPGGV